MPSPLPAGSSKRAVRTEPANPPDSHALAVTAFGLSDVGQKRASNEDHFVVAECARTLTIHHSNVPQPASASSCHRVHVFLVADGVGGNHAGEVASSLSVMTIEGFLLNALRRLTTLPIGEESAILNDLHRALFQADASIFWEAERHPAWGGMGTTLTLALAVNRQLLVAHAGDSRCYLFSHGTLQQITQDHTLPAEMARQGLITAQELKTHPWRHVVSNLLGGSEPGVRVELHSLELHPNDQVLLCSDGLTEMVPEDTIAAILRQEQAPEIACRKLIAEANRLGGYDNITAVVAHFLEPGSPFDRLRE